MVILQAAAPASGGTTNLSLFIFILTLVIIVIYYGLKHRKNSDIKYPALRVISGFYKVIAEIIAVISIILPIYLLFDVNQFNNNNYLITNITSISATTIFIGGIITATVLFAIGEAIKVFIDMEENTRNTAKFLKNYHVQNIKEETKVFCGNCGKETLKDDKYCANCGNEIK